MFYGVSEVLDDVRALSVAALSAIFIALLANAFAAVLRFKIIATEIEYPITFRRAVAAVSAGSLAGALFFQIAGQLMARGVIAGREGMPFAAVVAITAYERITAAIVSALFALGGAFFIFGHLYLDRSAGGADLIKIIVGLGAATAAGALMGYGRIAARAVTPLLTVHFVRRCLTIIGLTLLVHVPLQAAYVIAAHILSPQTSIADLIAASAIVMFATSVPISLAGWGLREMSAVVGLGAIGVPAHAALTAAITIGIWISARCGRACSNLSAADIRQKAAKEAQPVKPVDYYLHLRGYYPISAAILVLFQVYVPIQSGLINANLADPFAILGGVLFLLTAISLKRIAAMACATSQFGCDSRDICPDHLALYRRLPVWLDDVGRSEQVFWLVCSSGVWRDRRSGCSCRRKDWLAHDTPDICRRGSCSSWYRARARHSEIAEFSSSDRSQSQSKVLR